MTGEVQGGIAGWGPGWKWLGYGWTGLGDGWKGWVTAGPDWVTAGPAWVMAGSEGKNFRLLFLLVWATGLVAGWRDAAGIASEMEASDVDSHNSLIPCLP